MLPYDETMLRAKGTAENDDPPHPGLQRVIAGGRAQAALWQDGEHYALQHPLAELLTLRRDELDEMLDRASSAEPLQIERVLAPVDAQEIWGAGVTYRRSLAARVDEAADADPYERIYCAPRPELFFKATPARVCPCDQSLRLRADSDWDVPEPELALVLNSHREVIGYLIGNDLSSRSIEAENPLYLPQAKIFDGGLGLSRTIVLAASLDGVIEDARITLRVWRGEQLVVDGSTSVGSMHRSFDELSQWLFAELAHPHGVVLLTGTGVIPPREFSLAAGDEIEIEIEHLGRLRQTVAPPAPTGAPA